MTKHVFPILLLLGLGVLVLSAADFWEKKKYSEWTDKDVQKMLRDSPWARTVEIPLGSGGGLAGGRGRGRRGGGALPSAASAGGGGADEGLGGGGGGRGGGGLGDMESRPAMRVIVRWHTALPIRQAIARARFGNEAATSPEAAKMLSRQETSYIVGVAGLPAGVLRAKPEQLKSKAMLKVKGQQPILAENVQGDRDQNRVNLYFVFPKGQNGGHEITLDDKDVEFVVKLGNLEIKRKFRLKDMVYDGKLEM